MERARAKRKQDLENEKTEDFFFTDRMLKEIPEERYNDSTVPFPDSLKDRKTDFMMLSWNAWFIIVRSLKNKLRNNADRRRRKKIKESESDGNMLFSLQHHAGVFTLIIYQDWAATALNLPKTSTFEHPCPLEMYTKIMCKFHK